MWRPLSLVATILLVFKFLVPMVALPTVVNAQTHQQKSTQRWLRKFRTRPKAPNARLCKLKKCQGSARPAGNWTVGANR